MIDQSAPQNSSPVVIRTSTNFFNKQIFIYVGILLLGILLGFGAKTIISPQKVNPPLSTKPVIDESKLPISLPLLTNPIVYEWRGSVKGWITKKDEHTFTLIDDKGNYITITDIIPSGETWKTLFFDKTDKNKQASLSAIPVGSTLSGEFFLFKGDPNTPVGSMFVKQ